MERHGLNKYADLVVVNIHSDDLIVDTLDR